MKPINLFMLSTVRNLDIASVEQFARLLSDRGQELKIRDYEFQTVVSLVEDLSGLVTLQDLEGFYFSYSIPQLGEEFDLLKLSDTMVVNIELKSQNVGEKAILKQLRNKKHYLSHLSGNHYFYTYVKGDKLLYALSDDGNLVRCSITLLASLLKKYDVFFSGNLDEKFKVSQFLVSPVNSPEKFLHGNYFLTPQQELIEDKLLSQTENKYGIDPLFFSIHGSPGTGKTLLLYHLAKKLSSTKKVCIIHCAPHTEQHQKLKGMWPAVSIVVPKSLRYLNLGIFDVFIVDECQRIYTSQLNEIVSHVREHKKMCILGIDPKQVMSRKEKWRDIDSVISRIPGIQDHKLSQKIRTNKELSGFIEVMLNLSKAKPNVKYPNVSIIYANSYEEGKRIIAHYEGMGYTYISYTTSLHSYDKIDCMGSVNNTHKVIGQEFDNVLIMLDDHFAYDEAGRMQAKIHPNPDYLFAKLFYQGITRVREKLLLLVIDNPDLFTRITAAIGMTKEDVDEDSD